MKMIAFKSPAEFRSWLEKHHAEPEGLWLRIYKKSSGEASLTYAEALDEALCYGWIDGLKQSYDARSWRQRFTPRRPRSVWSKLNTRHVERLIRAGAMTPAGLRVVEAAQADGRWQAAYNSPSRAKPPEDFLAELKKNKRARAFYATLNRVNIFSIVYRLQTAKKLETRARRMKTILATLERGEKFHS